MLKNTNVRIALLLIFASIFLYVASFWIPEAEYMGNRLGPRFFPRLVLFGIVLLNLILIVQAVLHPEELKDLKPVPAATRSRFIFTMAGSVLFILAFSILGGLVAIFLFVLAYLWIWKERNVLTLILTPGLVTLGIYLVFVKFLSVRLPYGIFKGLF